MLCYHDQSRLAEKITLYTMFFKSLGNPRRTRITVISFVGKVDTFGDVNVHYTLIYSPHKACLFSNKDIPMNKEGCFSRS